jgi:hypothetical protein
MEVPSCNANQTTIAGRYGEVKCMDCKNGNVKDNRCLCSEGFYGPTCESNCRRELCSGRGTCNGTRRCICDDKWTGVRCNIPKPTSLRVPRLECIHGRYDPDENKCICEYGFIGKLCERKQPCVNGIIVDDRCLCDDGFSGRDCSIRRPLPVVEMREVEELRSSLSRRECINGQLIEGVGCVCKNGWGGENCGEYKCLRGEFNITSEACNCREGWTGTKCDVNCYSSCSNKGTICNAERVCSCKNGWSGEYCNNKIVREQRTQVNISDYKIALDLNVDIDRNNVSVELVDCLDSSCLPLSLKYNKESLLMRRLQATNNEIRLTMDEELVGVNKSVFVYLEEDNTKNYTFNSTDVVIQEPVAGTYLFNSISRIVESPYVNDIDTSQPINGDTSTNGDNTDTTNNGNGDTNTGTGNIDSRGDTTNTGTSATTNEPSNTTPSSTDSSLDSDVNSTSDDNINPVMIIYVSAGGLLAIGSIIAAAFYIRSVKNDKKEKKQRQQLREQTKEKNTILIHNPLNE